MGKKDKRIDAYIEKSADFAKPVLKKLRELVHKACPETEETIKWGMPSYEYKGPLCSMAAFKHHAVFGFWKYKLLKDPKDYLGFRSNEGGTSMGNLGKITSVKDLPPDKVFIGFIKQAKKLNDEGIKITPKPKMATAELLIPTYLTDALKKNKKARDTFEGFSYSNKKEYAEWLTDAKTEATREKRLATTLEWLEEGKIRNWKYVKK